MDPSHNPLMPSPLAGCTENPQAAGSPEGISPGTPREFHPPVWMSMAQKQHQEHFSSWLPHPDRAPTVELESPHTGPHPRENLGFQTGYTATKRSLQSLGEASGSQNKNQKFASFDTLGTNSKTRSGSPQT